MTDPNRAMTSTTNGDEDFDTIKNLSKFVIKWWKLGLVHKVNYSPLALLAALVIVFLTAVTLAMFIIAVPFIGIGWLGIKWYRSFEQRSE